MLEGLDPLSSRGARMPRPLGLHHVALTVTDLDKTIHFYQTLGLELLRTSGPNAHGERSAVMKVGGQEMNLFSAAGLVSIEQENPTGVHHFCLKMGADSIDDLIADLREVGVEISKGPVARRDGTSVFVSDPDGARVELLLERAR
jgi:catechol 2,3-dioxygenase-like lactoylglutathione lyase family enzyme